MLESGAFRMVAIGVPTAAEGPEAARSLLAEDAQFIGLCGGFGPAGTAAVLSVIGGAVPVGSVGYGPESIAALARIFAT